MVFWMFATCFHGPRAKLLANCTFARMHGVKSHVVALCAEYLDADHKTGVYEVRNTRLCC